MQTYLQGWKLGLKALAIYRDGCKRSQPLNTGKTEEKADEAAPAAPAAPVPRALRRRMPSTRTSITHKFDIAGHEGYLTVGLYDEGTPGELFITMAKEGSTIGGLMDSFGTAISLCLQYGVPLKTLVEKFAHSRFEPSGFTKNPDIPIAKSLPDYIFRWLGQTFLGGGFKVPAPKSLQPEGANGEAAATPGKTGAAKLDSKNPLLPGMGLDVKVLDEQFRHFMEDAPACDNCGAITVRNGACYRCYNCGNSMGCS